MREGFGGVAYQNVTNIHPLAIAAVVILGIAMLIVSRRWSILPMIIIACFVPTAQKISIFDMDFNVLRIMVLFGVCRVILHKEYRGFVWKPLDTAIVLWTVSFMVIYIVQQGSFAAVVNRLGFGFDAFGMYFLFRCLIRGWQDIDRIVLGFIVIGMVVAVFFIIENRTRRNMFSVFGGVPAITMMRQGKLRCQGAFQSPIDAGCFWASLMPLMAAYWWKSDKDRVWAVMGLSAAAVIVVCSASSTPVFGVLCGLLGGLLFFYRSRMQMIFWGGVTMLIALHLVMEGPVWHLISRVSAVGGSTGYFRYLLIDQAIRHFSEWAIIGTKSTAHWFFGAQDLCNYYVYQGVLGGFLTLCLFIAVLSIAFGGVGRLWRTQVRSPYGLALAWAMGVSLFVHCASFIGIAYIGTITLPWYLLLAMIGSMATVKRGVTVPSRAQCVFRGVQPIMEQTRF